MPDRQHLRPVERHPRANSRCAQLLESLHGRWDTARPDVAMDVHIYRMTSGTQVAPSGGEHVAAPFSQEITLGIFHPWAIASGSLLLLIAPTTSAGVDAVRVTIGRIVAPFALELVRSRRLWNSL